MNNVNRSTAPTLDMSNASRQEARRCMRIRNVIVGGLVAALLAPLTSTGVAGAAIDAQSMVTTVYTYPDNPAEINPFPSTIRYAAGAIYEAWYPELTPFVIRRRVIGQEAVVVAGGGNGSAVDGASAVGAALSVTDFDVAPDGTIVFIEGNKIRRVSPSGVLSTIGGNGSPVSSGDGGPATAAGMSPTAVGIDPAGNILVGEDPDEISYLAPAGGDERLRRIATDGTIRTLATFPGAGTTYAKRIFSIDFDGSGRAYVLMYSSQSGYHTVVELQRVAPDGTSARIGAPADTSQLFLDDIDVAVDGTIYGVEVYNSQANAKVVRIASDGTETVLNDTEYLPDNTPFPTAPSPLAQATIVSDTIAVSPSGDIYLVDVALRKVTNLLPSPAVTPVQPARILDTRPGAEQTGYTGSKPAAGSTLSLQVAGRGGVPLTGVAAVTMNVVITDADAAGFVTLWPSGQARPLAAHLNAEGAGSTAANLVTVPLGADGKVNLFTQNGGHLIADVSGWVPSGVYVPKTPTRILDTRPGAEQIGYTGAKPGVGSTVDLQITGVQGIPTSGVAAVVLNLTAADATGQGFVTAFPAGQALPLAASLYLDAAGSTAPNQVTVPIGAGGKISIFVQSGAHLIADLAGYYNVSSGFTPLTPARLLDTRPAPQSTGYVGPKPAQGQTVNFQVAGKGGVPSSGVGAVVLNLTATEATNPGFVTAWPGPASASRPLAAVMNLTYIGQTRSNAMLVPVGADGTVNLFTQNGTHLIVDVMGWIPAG